MRFCLMLRLAGSMISGLEMEQAGSLGSVCPARFFRVVLAVGLVSLWHRGWITIGFPMFSSICCPCLLGVRTLQMHRARSVRVERKLNMLDPRDYRFRPRRGNHVGDAWYLYKPSRPP